MYPCCFLLAKWIVIARQNKLKLYLCYCSDGRPHISVCMSCEFLLREGPKNWSFQWLHRQLTSRETDTEHSLHITYISYSVRYFVLWFTSNGETYAALRLQWSLLLLVFHVILACWCSRNFIINIVPGLSLKLTNNALVMSQLCDSCRFWNIITDGAPGPLSLIRRKQRSLLCSTLLKIKNVK